jgi:hypothetical protein
MIAHLQHTLFDRSTFFTCPAGTHPAQGLQTTGER